MRRKVIQSNNKLAVTLPSEIIDRWNLEPGAVLNFVVDEKIGGILITPTDFTMTSDAEFDALVDEIIEEYRPVLESLAER